VKTAETASSTRVSGYLRNVWWRFFAAILGLALAFAAALFSTVARESGSLVGTLLLASFALLLATFVGLTTVPYLARRVATARMRDVLDYEVTRVGVIYAGAVLLIGIAALNTGNNLLYVVASAMLAAIVISGFASALVLHNLELDLRLPERVFAGQLVPGKIVLRNQRRWTPSFSVSVVPIDKTRAENHWHWERTAFTFPPRRPPGQQWFNIGDWRLRRVPDAVPTPRILHDPVYFPYIPAKAAVQADLQLNFERRGRYQQDNLGLATRFPFAFLNKTRRVSVAREIIVFPPVDPTDDFVKHLPLMTGELEAFVRGRGSDLYRIREYMPEDSARHVDWKATAKSGALKVREFSREDERKVRIVFDNPGSDVSPTKYEKLVALAASVTWHFAHESAELQFAAQRYSGRPDADDFLAYLAVVQPGSSPSIVDRLQRSEDYNIILTARPRGTIPTALWNCSYFVFID
jgi:uncharacterized protein (DUF58 family)